MPDKVSRRQRAILDLIARQGFVATDTLVRKFDVTPQTIRRDLNVLAGSGSIARFHGGAGQSSTNHPYSDRRLAARPAKRLIARATAALVPDGASLFLNIGTTTEAVAEALLDHSDLTVITNNLNVARILSQNDSFTIMMSGGQVRNADGGIIGAQTVEFIDGFRTDFGIIGISAVDGEGTLLEFDPREVKTTQAIMRNSARVVLVSDSGKFGRRATNRLGQLDDLDVLVTDSAPTGPLAARLATGDVQLIVADPEDGPEEDGA